MGYNNDLLQNKKTILENASADLIKTTFKLYIIFGLTFLMIILLFLYFCCN